MNREHPFVVRAGLCSALLGAAAGVTEVVVGTAAWLGDKNDPTTLGFVTIFLGLVIGTAALTWRWATTTPRVLAVATAMLGPALLGLTTAGVAWLPAAVAATVGGLSALRHCGDVRSVRQALSEQWPGILLGCLALIHLALGITARGLTGALAAAAGLAIVGALLLRHRSRTFAALMLVAGTLPFAVVAWWSVVPPVTALLTLAIGLPHVLTSTAHPGSPGEIPNESSLLREKESPRGGQRS